VLSDIHLCDELVLTDLQIFKNLLVIRCIFNPLDLHLLSLEPFERVIKFALSNDFERVLPAHVLQLLLCLYVLELVRAFHLLEHEPVLD